MPCEVRPDEADFHDCLTQVGNWTDKEADDYITYGKTPCSGNTLDASLRNAVMDAIYDDR